MFKDTICLNTKILHFICNVQLKDAQIFRKYRFYRKTLVIRMMTWRKFNFEYSITLETAVRNSNPTATWSPGIVHFWYDNSRWMITMTVIRPMYLYISRLIKTCLPFTVYHTNASSQFYQTFVNELDCNTTKIWRSVSMNQNQCCIFFVDLWMLPFCVWTRR